MPCKKLYDARRLMRLLSPYDILHVNNTLTMLGSCMQFLAKHALDAIPFPTMQSAACEFLPILHFPTPSLPSATAARAAATITQPNNLVVHIVNTGRATGGDALPVCSSHDDRPPRIQQLKHLSPRLHPSRRSIIQAWIHVHG